MTRKFFIFFEISYCKLPPELQQLQSLFGARRSVIRLLGYLLLHHITPFRITHPSFASCLCPGPLCILTCSSDELRRQAGPWEFEYAQFGAVLLGPMCAALSSDVLPFGRRGSTGTQRYRLLLICLLPGPMCHRPSSDVSRRKVGSWEYGWHSGAFCFAPCVRLPPLVCAQQ